MMTIIPHHWSWVKLGEVAKLIRGVSYKKDMASKSSKPHCVPIVRANNINTSLNFDDLVYVPEELVKDEQFIKAGDIIIAMSSGSKDLVGKAAQAITESKTAFGTFCGLVRFSSKNVYSKFFGFYFHSKLYRDHISKVSMGVNINNLRREHIEELILPLPPLPEQKKIVEKIEELFGELDNGVASLKRAKEQIKLYRQSVLKAAFSGYLVPFHSTGDVKKLISLIKSDKDNHYREECLNAKLEGRHKPNKIAYPKMIVNHALYDLPHNWVWETIFMTSNYDGNAIVDGPFGSNLKTSDYDSRGKVPVITISNIEEGFQKLRFINERKYEEVKRSTVYPGDVIVAKIGSSYGKVGYYPENMVKGIIPANLLKISVSERFNKQYLFYYLKSHYFKKHLDLITKYTAQPAFNVSKFKALPIPIPVRREQDLIVEEIEKRFSEADNLGKAIDESLGKAEALRQAILKKAFEGKLI